MTGFNKRIAQALGRKTATTNLEITKVKPIRGDAFGVIASFPRRMDREEANAVVMESTDHRVKIVPGTFRALAVPKGFAAQMVVAGNRVSKPFSETASMTAMSDAQFADDNDQIWNVIGDGGSRRVVLAEPDDLADILAARRSRQPAPALASLDVNFHNGDFASYLGTGNETRYGFALRAPKDRAIILNPVNAGAVEIASAEIIEAGSPRGVIPGWKPPVMETAAPIPGLDYSPLWDYLKRIYVNNPELLERLKAMMGQ